LWARRRTPSPPGCCASVIPCPGLGPPATSSSIERLFGPRPWTGHKILNRHSRYLPCACDASRFPSSRPSGASHRLRADRRSKTTPPMTVPASSSHVSGPLAPSGGAGHKVPNALLLNSSCPALRGRLDGLLELHHPFREDKAGASRSHGQSRSIWVQGRREPRVSQFRWSAQLKRPAQHLGALARGCACRGSWRRTSRPVWCTTASPSAKRRASPSSAGMVGASGVRIPSWLAISARQPHLAAGESA